MKQRESTSECSLYKERNLTWYPSTRFHGNTENAWLLIQFERVVSFHMLSSTFSLSTYLIFYNFLKGNKWNFNFKYLVKDSTLAFAS